VGRDNVFQAILRFFGKEDEGQDLAEYCLITALVALVGLGILIHLSGGMQAVWNNASTTLVAGNASTGTSGTTAATASTPAAGTQSGSKH
jgi:Flp pilus assembly pilin Flp